MALESFAAFAGLKGIEGMKLEDLLLFTKGNESQSPYDNPEIVRPSKIDNYYERLGLENFIEEESSIKGAYRQQSLIWHPDRPHNVDHKKEANEDYIAVQEAYETLIDPAKKAEYDRILKREVHEREEREPPREQPGTGPRMNNAERAAQYSRSFVDLKEVNDMLSPDQREKVDYLDSLVDRGEVSFGGFGETLVSGSKPCGYCKDNLPIKLVNITYRNKYITLMDMDAHNLLAHGARAMFHHVFNMDANYWSREQRIDIAFDHVERIYSELQIKIPPTHLNEKESGAIPLPASFS